MDSDLIAWVVISYAHDPFGPMSSWPGRGKPLQLAALASPQPWVQSLLQYTERVCPSLKPAVSPRKPGSFYLGLVFRKQALDPLSRQEVGNGCVHMCACTYHPGLLCPCKPHTHTELQSHSHVRDCAFPFPSLLPAL